MKNLNNTTMENKVNSTEVDKVMNHVLNTKVVLFHKEMEKKEFKMDRTDAGFTELPNNQVLITSLFSSRRTIDLVINVNGDGDVLWNELAEYEVNNGIYINKGWKFIDQAYDMFLDDTFKSFKENNYTMFDLLWRYISEGYQLEFNFKSTLWHDKNHIEIYGNLLGDTIMRQEVKGRNLTPETLTHVAKEYVLGFLKPFFKVYRKDELNLEVSQSEVEEEEYTLPF